MGAPAKIWQRIGDADIEYVRADIAERQLAEMTAERDRLKRGLMGAVMVADPRKLKAAEARVTALEADKTRLDAALPLIKTALEHASFALDGIVALDDEDMGKDGGSATAQHTKRTVDRALEALRALTKGDVL